MSAVHAIEAAWGVELHPQVRALRRLYYAGEWIESHLLHMIFLDAPDFLRLDDAHRDRAPAPSPKSSVRCGCANSATAS